MEGYKSISGNYIRIDTNGESQVGLDVIIYLFCNPLVCIAWDIGWVMLLTPLYELLNNHDANVLSTF